MKNRYSAGSTLLALLLCTALTAQEGANPFGFTGHEYDSETGLYYMKGRYYDPETGRFLTPDPAIGNPTIPMTLHPYIYAMENPTVYVDPDGREVRILNEGSLELIKSTLPEDLREAVQVGDNGLLKKEQLNAVKTNDPNFLALKELVNSSHVTAVQVGEQARFIDAEGVLVQEPFSFQMRDQVIEEMVKMGVSREQLERDIPADQKFLFLGILATPRENPNKFDNQATISLTEEATATIADESVAGDLTQEEKRIFEMERSKTAAHEIFGHALLFQRGEKFGHGDVPESIFDAIEQRTEDIYNKNMTGIIQENSELPGVKVIKEKKNENQY